ncbi:hypothetical protein B0H14DRAFT_3854314 [Mycena olivaceomarginata]|nr:hypothetical protein B0H14DRAFT_3854314 [Mycena olivaceomarginata]
MAGQSTLRQSTAPSSTARGGRTSTSNPAAGANKENLRAPNTVPRQGHGAKNSTPVTSKKSKAQENTEPSDNDDDVDRDYSPPSDSEHQHDDNEMDDQEDDTDEHNTEAGPIQGRIRVMSAKQAQLLWERKEVEVRRQEKAAKAVKAAKKKAGVSEPDIRGPIQDDTFTSRTITSTRPTATKNLAQHNSRVPAPAQFPRADWHENSRCDGHSHNSAYSDDDDNSTQGLHAAPQQAKHTFHGHSPLPKPHPIRTLIRNINGGIVPDRVSLHLGPQPQTSYHEDLRPDSPRSESPDAGDKRRRSDSVDSEDLRSTQSPKATASRSRPRAKDLDDLSKETFFPDHNEEPPLVQRAFNKSCKALNVKMIMTPTIYKLIANRGPHLRGELKTKIKPFTEIMKLAEDLKEEACFAFKDTERKKGLFKHPILQKGTNAIWFANRRDEGPSHPEIFNPLPEEALAAVLTATENTIDEYLTGIRTDVPFTANEYRSVYETHLKSLRQFREHTIKYELLDKILTRLHNIRRFHAGAQPLSIVPTSTLSIGVLDAALREYEEDLETETEGEQGEHSDPEEGEHS